MVIWKPGCGCIRGSSTGCCCGVIWMSVPGWRSAAVEAARGSFDDAQEAIERATGVQLGKRQVEGLARHAAVDVDAFYTARRPQPCPDRVLGLQCDGKGIL